MLIKLTSIDLSSNPSLDTLDISNNLLSSTINLSANTMLITVKISSISLININLSANTALTSLDVSDNMLSSLDLRNGTNNSLLALFNALNNSNLNCVSVDDAAWSTANWTNIDAQTFFSNNCAGIPVAGFTSNQTEFCLGNSVIFTDTSTNSPNSWSWDFGDGTNSSIQNPTHTYLVAGVYTVILTASNVNGSTTETKTGYITVYALPTVDAGQDTTVCEGDSVVLSGSGAVNYLWDNGITNGTPFLPVVGITKYIVTGTDGNSCINVDSVTVFVNSIPVVEAGLGHTICEGDSIVLSGQYSGGILISSDFWDNGVVDGVLFAPPLGNTTYTYTVEGSPNCVVSDSVDITVVALPSVSAGSNFTVCPLEPIVLSGAGAANYTWNNNVIDGVQFSQGSGAVTYSVTGFANGCHATATIVVTELPELEVHYDITHADCDSSNGSVMAVPLITGPSYTYSWSNGDLNNFAEDLTAGPLNIMIGDGQCNYYDVVLVGNANGGPTVNVNNVIGESCLGASDGEIQLLISSSNPPYSVSWLCAGNDESITNLPAGLYQFTVTDQSNCITSDFVHVSAPDSLAISTVTIADPTCGLSDGSISLGVTGGSGTVTYTWSANASGQTGSSITALAAGLYSVIISDGAACNVTADFQVNNASSLAIGLLSINVPSCGNTGGLNVFAQGGNSPYSYLWNNGDTTQNLIAVEPGNYSLEVTDSLGCLAYYSQELLPTNQFNPSICLITVDAISENNIIVWEKPITAGDLSHFNIYRECCSSGLTNYLATVPYDSLSEYMDTTCLPQSTNWSYQLTVVDTCGNESFKSALHRSIHIATYPEANNTIGLYWNQYIGFPYATHYIYRNHPSTGLVLIDSVDYTITSHVDANPVAPFNELSYFIEVTPPSTCTSTKSVDHNTTRSNRGGFNEVEEPDGVMENELVNIHVYPNPTNGELMVALNQIKLPCKIEIKDIRGRIIYAKNIYTNQLKINLSAYETGMYILSVYNEQQKKEIKIIKN